MEGGRREAGRRETYVRKGASLERHEGETRENKPPKKSDGKICKGWVGEIKNMSVKEEGG